MPGVTAGVAASCLAAVLLSACAVGPNFVPPEAPPVSRYTKEKLANPSAANTIRTRQGGSADQSFVSGADIPGQWWTLFHSKALNRLVEQALANNPTLEAAQAALRIAQQNVLAQKGTLYPSLTATPQAEGVKAPGLDLQSPLQNQTQYLYSLYTPQAVVSYNPDVFGGNKRQIESLEAATQNQRFQLEAAYLSLTANVVAAAIQEASLRAQIDATQKVIQAQIEVLQLYNKQLSLGQIAGADVVQQQAALALSQQLLPPLEKALAQQRDLLTALAGPAGLLTAASAPSLVLDVHEVDIASMARRESVQRHLAGLTALGPLALGIQHFTADTVPVGMLQLVGAASMSLDPDLLAATADNHSVEDLVRALVAGASALGVITIATNISSYEQLEMARAVGVHAVQGDLIGPAAPLDSYSDLLHGGQMFLPAAPASASAVTDAAAAAAAITTASPDAPEATTDHAGSTSEWVGDMAETLARQLGVALPPSPIQAHDGAHASAWIDVPEETRAET